MSRLEGSDSRCGVEGEIWGIQPCCEAPPFNNGTSESAVDRLRDPGHRGLWWCRLLCSSSVLFGLPRSPYPVN